MKIDKRIEDLAAEISSEIETLRKNKTAIEEQIEDLLLKKRHLLQMTGNPTKVILGKGQVAAILEYVSQHPNASRAEIVTAMEDLGYVRAIIQTRLSRMKQYKQITFDANKRCTLTSTKGAR